MKINKVSNKKLKLILGLFIFFIAILPLVGIHFFKNLAVPSEIIAQTTQLYKADFSSVWNTYTSFGSRSIIVAGTPKIGSGDIFSEIDTTGSVSGTPGESVLTMVSEGTLQHPVYYSSIYLPYDLPVTGAYSIQFNAKYLAGEDINGTIFLGTNRTVMGSGYTFRFTPNHQSQNWRVEKWSDHTHNTILASGYSPFINTGITLNNFRVDRNPTTGHMALYANGHLIWEISNETTYVGGANQLVFYGGFAYLNSGIIANTKVQFGNFTVISQ